MLKEITAKEFDELALSGIVLADFFSTTCGPCKMLSFVLKDIDKAFSDKVKILQIDFNQHKELTERYEVKGYPTLIFLKDGKEVDRLQGLQQKPIIFNKLEELLQKNT